MRRRWPTTTIPAALCLLHAYRASTTFHTKEQVKNDRTVPKYSNLPFKKVDDLEVELLFPLPLLLRGKLEVSMQHASTPI